MLQTSIKIYWEDSKMVSYWVFFFFLKVFNFVIFSVEKINLLIILLHLNTFLCLPLIFMFKKSWLFLVQYFLFQLIGSILIEIGFSFGFFSDFFVIFGMLLKLGILPLIWWYPSFLKKKKWLKFFFFKTLNKIPLFYLITFSFKSYKKFIFFFSLVLGFMGLVFSSNKISGMKNLKMFLGWASMLDGVFFCWLIFLDKKTFFLVFFFYILIYLIMSVGFYFSLKNLKMEESCMNPSVFNSGIFIFSSFLLMLNVGFPPFFPFLFKYTFMKNISNLFCLNFIYLFFFFSFFQGLVYLYIFFKIFKKKKFIFFKSFNISLYLVFFFFNSVLVLFFFL